MPTPTKGPRLGGSPQHERLLLSNLATALFEHGGITTTRARAKRLRPLAERLVTQAKKGDLHNRRLVLATVRDKDVVYRLFSEIDPAFAARPGGYTRITKLMPRKGDNAPMARIELVEAQTVAQEAVGEAERARGTRFRRGGAGEVPAATVVEPSASAAAAEPEDAEPVSAEPVSEATAEPVGEGPGHFVLEAPAEPAGVAPAEDPDAGSGAGGQAEAAADEAPAEGER